MKKFALIALLLAWTAPAGARPMTGMSALQYYAGSWACVGGSTAHPPTKASVTYVWEHGVMRDSIFVPKQGAMHAAYFETGAISYDAKLRRFSQSSLGDEGNWEIQTATPWAGNTELWYDRSTDDGKLGSTRIVRIDQDDFTITAFGPTSPKPAFKAVCKRSTGA